MTAAPPLLVSACLCGELCRYDALDATVPAFADLFAQGLAIPVCPEMLGGLSVPRDPCEILASRVLDRSGRDVTREFLLGAEKTLFLARERGVAAAVLKEGSPSCGVNLVYDGTFSSNRVPGRGITAAVLADNGITVFSEENFPLAEYLRAASRYGANA